ncbi:uncharacterized protein LOC116341107 [Contarinia nasturtii]|uniref:uncharacterized protein LOC116341107 n=1 Tax=Contarinia nasturtii TaxID=265458 RepID=UPI0012D47999|nr:uncharacterized protein LOC116341107 [Contarinia nasturtii]
MSQTNMQKVCQLLIFVMLIGVSVSRPNGNTDSQESSDNQLGMSDLEKNSYPFYRPMQSFQYFNMDEPTDRYQMQFRSFYPTNTLGMRGGSGGNLNFPLWQLDPYRQLVSKRQTRYRQCYFNPISCFKK